MTTATVVGSGPNGLAAALTLAARYLAEPMLHLSQVAGLLGYAEQSTLNRSCRRWFGMTPRQYRAAHGNPIGILAE